MRILIWTTLLFVNSVAARENWQINIVTEINPPLQIVENRELTGFAVELVQRVLDESPIEGEILAYPWARAFKMASEIPNTLIFSIRRTPMRETNFHWVGRVFSEQHFPKYEDELRAAQLTFICNKEADLSNHRSEDIRGKFSIAAPRHDFMTDHLIHRIKWPKNNLLLTVSMEDTLRLLKNKRADMALLPGRDLEDVVKRQNYDMSHFKVCHKENMPYFHLYFAFSEQTPANIVNMFKNSFEQIKQSSEYGAAYRKWFNE